MSVPIRGGEASVLKTVAEGLSGERSARDGRDAGRSPWSEEKANAWWEEAVQIIMATKRVSRAVAEAEANTY